MSKSRNLLACGLLSAMFLMTGGQAYAGELADTVYYGGRIYTMTEAKADIDAGKPDMAEVVAAKDGKIVFVGSKADAESKGYLSTDEKQVSKLVDLKGKTMYPGFVDGHSHFPNQGTDDLYKVNLNSPLYDGPVTCIADLVAELKARAAVTPKGTLIEGYNYDDTKLGEGETHPTAKQLDEATPDHPIIIKHISGHVSVANTMAMELCGLTKEKAAKFAGVVKYEDGTPTGVLMETEAMGLVGAKLTDADGNETVCFPTLTQDTQAAIARASQVYAAAGVTTADNGGSILMSDVPAWQTASVSGKLGVRLVAHPFGYFLWGTNELGMTNRMALGWKNAQAGFNDGTGTPGTGADISQIGVNVGTMVLPERPDVEKNRIFLGAWKFIFDGSPQAYTAWMKSPGNYYLGEHTESEEALDKETEKVTFDAYKGFNGLPGTVSIAPKVLEEKLKLYHNHGFSTETHTNGSGAAEAWLTAIENIVAEAGNSQKDTRHTSIHGQTLERQHIERMTGNYQQLASTGDMYTDLMGAGAKAAKGEGVGNLAHWMKDQNIFCSFFNNHVYFYGDRHHDIFFGPGRAMNISPTGWAEYYGLPYSFHNDTDVTPISPLRSIQTAVTRMTEGGKLLSVEGATIDQVTEIDSRKYADGTTGEPMKFWQYDHRISALKAIHAVTTGPAWQNKLEDRIGMIREGYLADFTVMDKDIIQQAEDDGMKIAEMRVAATIVGDKVIHGVLPASDNFAFGGALSSSSDAGVTLDAADVAKPTDVEKAIGEGEKLLGAVAMTAKTKAEGDIAVFTFKVLGNGEALANIDLRKPINGEVKEFTYNEAGAVANGNWWVSSFSNPLLALPLAETVLEKDQTYIVSFAIQDNEEFDANPEPCAIADPVALVGSEAPDNGAAVTETANAADNARPMDETKITPPAKKDNGGSSGGCTVGTNPAYELLALLLAALGVTAARGLRRRDA